MTPKKGRTLTANRVCGGPGWANKCCWKPEQGQLAVRPSHRVGRLVRPVRSRRRRCARRPSPRRRPARPVEIARAGAPADGGEASSACAFATSWERVSPRPTIVGGTETLFRRSGRHPPSDIWGVPLRVGQRLSKMSPRRRAMASAISASVFAFCQPSDPSASSGRCFLRGIRGLPPGQKLRLPVEPGCTVTQVEIP